MHAPLIAVEPEMSPPSYSGLLQMLEQIDQKHEAGHKRLRETIIELKEQHEDLLASLLLLKDRVSEHAATIKQMSETPPNIEKLIMTPRVVIGIVVMVLTIAGAIWGSNASITTRMDAASATAASAREVQSLQWSQMRADIEEVKKQQKLQQIEDQNLKEMILSGGLSPIRR